MTGDSPPAGIPLSGAAMLIPSIRRSANRTAPKPARRRLSVEHLEARDVPTSISGIVFDDLNANAIQDSGELGLAGWTVFIDNDRDGVPRERLYKPWSADCLFSRWQNASPIGSDFS